MRLKLMLILLLAFAAVGLMAGQISITEFEHLIWKNTNAERAKNNLPPLVYDEGLADMARQHSRNMVAFGFFDHTDQIGHKVNGRKKRLYPQLIVSSIGENLARFYNTDGIYTPQEIVSGWMKSPLHRENILDKRFTHIGVGVINYEGMLLATQNFATPLVKLQSTLPTKMKRKQRYTLEFEYMSPNLPEKLLAQLNFPNKKISYQVSKNVVTVGSKPITINWIDSKRFTVDIDFVKCTGNYELVFGFGGGYYEEGVVLKVK